MKGKCGSLVSYLGLGEQADVTWKARCPRSGPSAWHAVRSLNAPLSPARSERCVLVGVRHVAWALGEEDTSS